MKDWEASRAQAGAYYARRAKPKHFSNGAVAGLLAMPLLFAGVYIGRWELVTPSSYRASCDAWSTCASTADACMHKHQPQSCSYSFVVLLHQLVLSIMQVLQQAAGPAS